MNPVYVIPLLVEQPTWGGHYIAEFKNIRDAVATTPKIGQAFELYRDACVTSIAQTEMPFAYATATNLKEPQFFHRPADIQTLQSVIDQDPIGFLGQKAIDQYGKTMQVLIKFTQAQNNSYQAHVRPGQEFGKWQAKPESWYYFEKGKATLGLSSTEPTTVAAYKKRCTEIDQHAQELSKKVLAKEIDVAGTRAELKKFIQQDHPQKYVNTVVIEPNQVIDLSSGGTHHSWEMSPEIPNGNIVYEVQKDVMDEFCTLRSFDQGNIKDDGKVRPLTIDEYFQALNTNAEQNKTQQYLKTPQPQNEEGAVVTELFNNQFYKTISLKFSGKYSGKYANLDGSFHHLFVQSGKISAHIGEKSWGVSKGWSLLIPANTKHYELHSDSESVVLQTSVSQLS